MAQIIVTENCSNENNLFYVQSSLAEIFSHGIIILRIIKSKARSEQ